MINDRHNTQLVKAQDQLLGSLEADYNTLAGYLGSKGNLMTCTSSSIAKWVILVDGKRVGISPAKGTTTAQLMDDQAQGNPIQWEVHLDGEPDFRDHMTVVDLALNLNDYEQGLIYSIAVKEKAV